MDKVLKDQAMLFGVLNFVIQAGAVGLTVFEDMSKHGKTFWEGLAHGGYLLGASQAGAAIGVAGATIAGAPAIGVGVAAAIMSVLVGFGAEALYANFPIVEDTVDAIGDILESLFTKEIDVGPKDRIPAE